MTKQVAKTKGNAVSTEVQGGIAGDLSNDDVQQGRLTLMQPGSDFVKEEKCRQGSIVNLQEPEIELAHKGYKDEEAKPLDFMIVGVMKYWVVKDKNTKDFVAKFPGVNANELPWEEEVDGKLLTRTFHFSYVVLLPEEIKDGLEMPYEFAFRSTAVKETKKLNSVIQRLGAKGISSHQRVFRASISQRTNGEDTWWGADLSIGRDATAKETEVCIQYFNEFNTTKAKFMAQQDAPTEQKSAPKTVTKADAEEKLNNVNF